VSILVRCISLLFALIVSGVSGAALAADNSGQPLRWRDVREDPVAREEFLEQRREQRERIRQIRQELRRDLDVVPPPMPSRVLERRNSLEARSQDRPLDSPDRLSQPRRLSPEERTRFREDMREVWREPRSRR